MLKGDIIEEVHKRFTHIVNHLIGLGKTIDKKELIIKIVKCLYRTWQLKVTTISESNDLTIASLFGKLREHEIEMNRLNKQEIGEKQIKGITLKSSIQKTESSDCSDTKTLNLLTRKFRRFLKMKGKDKAQS